MDQTIQGGKELVDTSVLLVPPNPERWALTANTKCLVMFWYGSGGLFAPVLQLQ